MGIIRTARNKKNIIVDNWHYIGGAGEPAFGAGWSNLAGYSVMGFKKLPFDNAIQIRANVVSNGASATICTLPVGYRPRADVDLPVLFNAAGTYTARFITISTAGVVAVPVAGAATYIIFYSVFYTD
jgi:hypothetical protein